jgi:hypothetical protein
MRDEVEAILLGPGRRRINFAPVKIDTTMPTGAVVLPDGTALR